MIFPRTIAQDQAFCNRDEERRRLKYNFKNMQHTLVLSPRRYGKTSLILQSIKEIKWPYAYIDLFLAYEEHKIIERFLAGIAKLISLILPINMKAISKIRDFFKSFGVSLSVGNVTLELKLEPANLSASIILNNALQGLTDLLKKYKKTAIFFVDEMQDIVRTSICGDIEATLRFYAQQSTHIAFIFSGSNRRLLHEIFDDKARPLFKMCDRLNLKRIKAEDYIKFLNHAAQKEWSNNLDPTVINSILTLTERHPYYVNYLCSHLWRLDYPPTVEQVQNIWNQMTNEEANGLAIELDGLTLNQKRLLEYIAQKGGLTHMTAQKNQQQLQLTSRGILQSLTGLLEKDFLEKNDGQINIVDPMLKTLLLR